MTHHSPSPSRAARLAHEFRSYLLLAGYMFLCFLAFAIYKAAVLAEENVAFAPVAFAAVKALVLSKFLMLGEALPVVTRDRGGSLVISTLHRSVWLLLLLFVLMLVEEVARAWIHGASGFEELAADMARRHWEMAAALVLLWLVLLPYVGIKQLAGRLGEEQWRRVLRGEAL
jgi:hypothetical protein